MEYNTNGDQQPPPAEVKSEMDLFPPSVVKLLGYEFLDAALRKLPGYEFLDAALRARLPICWSNGVGKAESITLDTPTSPKYTGEGKRPRKGLVTGIANDGRYQEGSVRTDFPIPAELNVYYYEVTIVNAGENEEKCIAIGFGRRSKSMNSLPGWHNSDRAFHLNDGQFLYGDYEKGEQYYGGKSPIEDGAVYGCGVDFRSNEMFFTKIFTDGDGDVIAKYVVRKSPEYGMTFRKGALYPVVGLCYLNTQLDTNFGQKRFKFDLESYYNRPVEPKIKKKSYGRPSEAVIQNSRTAIKRTQSMAEENLGPKKIPRRGVSVTLPSLEDSLDAENLDHVYQVRNDVKPMLDNSQQIETERDITLAESEHSQTNAMSNVADNSDPNLSFCESDEADNVEIVNNTDSRANNQSQVKNEPESLETGEINGETDGFDINEVLDLIRRDNAQEAEAKIIASEFGSFYENTELVLLLKIQMLIGLWKGNEETEADVRKLHLLGKSISSLVHGTPSLGAGIQKKVEDSLLLSFCAKTQVHSKLEYLLVPDGQVVELIKAAFETYKAAKFYQNLMSSCREAIK